MLSELGNLSVLVTGAGGFIGSHLIASLIASGAVVHAVLRPGSSAPRFKALGLRPSIHHADIADIGSVPDLVSKLRPDVVINLAVCRENDAPHMIHQTNVIAALAMLEACQYPGFRRFVTIGSSLERLVDGAGVSGSPYALSRTRAATLMREQAVELGIHLTHLRTYYVYGPLQEARKLIPSALRTAGTKTSLPLAPDNLSKDFVHVRDLTRACIAAVLSDRPGYTVADIASGQEWSARAVIGLLEQATGKSIQTHPDNTMARAWDRGSWETDPDPARDLFGWEPRISLREGLRELVAMERTPCKQDE